MTLFRNFAVLRQQCGNPFAPIQILTGDTRKPCGSRRGRLHDECRSLQLQSCIDRRFESSPESRGSQTSGVLLVLFVHAKRIKPFSLSGKIRGSANLESAHKNINFALSHFAAAAASFGGTKTADCRVRPRVCPLCHAYS